MNKKIKEINIKAFRAYKDEQKFDFKHRINGRVADLVAIYAPNGYGKTSFFDAIEWAVTGKIDRLNAGQPIKEEVKKEGNHILKNRDSKEPWGNVTIISEDDGIFSINTKEKKGKMKNDYWAGIPDIISHQLKTILEEKGTFCTTNLLAHDKITGFLQNYTAEDKTNELRVMWDRNNYSEILEEITDIYNELEKKKKELTTDISKGEEELKAFTYEKEKIDKIVKSLLDYETRFNKKVLKEEDFEVEEMLMLFEQFHEVTQREREEKEKAYSDSELLLKEYSKYEENIKAVDFLEKQKQEYEKAIGVLENVELLQTKSEKIKKESRQIRDLLSKLKTFYTCIEKKTLNLKKLQEVEKSKTDCQKESIRVVERIEILNKALQENKYKIEKLDEKKTELRQNYIEFNDNYLKMSKYERLIDIAKYILEQRNNKVQKYCLYMEQIDLFLKGKLGVGILYGVLSDEIVVKYSQIERLNLEMRTLRENNDILECSRKNLVGLYDKLQQLSIKGRDIVNEQRTNECPLCHMQYTNYEELWGKISTASQENIDIEKLDEQIRKNKEREVRVDMELKRMIEEVQKDIQLISNRYEEEYLRETKKIKKLQATIEMWERIANAASAICDRFKVKYQLEKLEISIYKAVQEREELIEKQIQKVNDEIENVQTVLKVERDTERELEKKIKSYELKILDIREENNEIETNQLYIEVEKILQEKVFYEQSKSYFETKAALDVYFNQLIERKKSWDKEIEGYLVNEMLSKDEYITKLKECHKELNKLQIEISGYILRCEGMIGKVKDGELEKALIRANYNLQQSIKTIVEKKQKEMSIIWGLNGLKDQKMWMMKKKKVENNREELAFLLGRIEKLQKSKNFVEDYIMVKTNEYFNSDIINQIYNKIDPHPTMKHIKFVTEKDSKGLKTRIYTYDESESDKMSPVVYLSSAQVNILSLCIFLSKVLSEKDTTFNTIFIDDPIQHLDGINLLSFIDVLRTITTDLGRQIVISTHNEQFYKLLKVKMDEKYYPSKFIELSSTGTVKA